MSNSIAAADPPRDTNGQQQDDNPFAEKAAEEARKPKKPSPLASIITGKRTRPIFCLVYGPPGIGKTTFASQAPTPVYLDTERGSDQVGAARFPTPATYLEFALQLDALDKEEHPYQSIVIDTFDALEPLIVQKACDDLKTDALEKLERGAGYIHAKNLWRRLLTKLRLMSERFNIIMLGHASVKPFNDPSLPAPYDTWKMRINDKCADVIKESVDTILFACLDLEIHKQKITDKKGRAVTSGDHILRTRPAAGYDAKNRFDLEDPILLEWAALESAVKEFYAK
jgi:hypothetical protein